MLTRLWFLSSMGIVCVLSYLVLGWTLMLSGDVIVLDTSALTLASLVIAMIGISLFARGIRQRYATLFK